MSGSRPIPLWAREWAFARSCGVPAKHFAARYGMPATRVYAWKHKHHEPSDLSLYACYHCQKTGYVVETPDSFECVFCLRRIGEIAVILGGGKRGIAAARAAVREMEGLQR